MKEKRPDFGSIIGACVAVGAIVGGLMLEGGRFADIRQLTAAMIVLGGTFGALLITTPFDVFLASLRRLSELVLYQGQPFDQTADLLVKCADRARKAGLPALEKDAQQISNPFLRKGLNLVADGTDIHEIGEMLRLDLEVEEERLECESKVWESAAGYSPTIGIIGAVLGLIQVMKHLENIGEVGRGIAVAFVATVYGVAAANLLFLPAAGKLGTHNQEQIRFREMIIQGVLAIAEGMNPKAIAHKLSVFTKDSSINRLGAGPAPSEKPVRPAAAA